MSVSSFAPLRGEVRNVESCIIGLEYGDDVVVSFYEEYILGQVDSNTVSIHGWCGHVESSAPRHFRTHSELANRPLGPSITRVLSYDWLFYGPGLTVWLLD